MVYGGSAACRKRITADDWKSQDIQKRYQNYFSPYLKARITDI